MDEECKIFSQLCFIPEAPIGTFAATVLPFFSQAPHHILLLPSHISCFVICKTASCRAVPLTPGRIMSLSDSAVPRLVVAESRLQKHSLQTAQNLLQEEVARAEERSEVRTTSSSPSLRRRAEPLISRITLTRLPCTKTRQSGPPASVKAVVSNVQ